MTEIAIQVKQLQTQLIEIGQEGWATQIEDAVLGGCTGTEILDRLGVCLTKLSKSELKLPADVSALCKQILKEIKRRYRP